MKHKYFIFAATLSALSVAQADPLIVELNQKVQYLEEENRQLKGSVEELTHAYRTLSQEFKTFSSDIEMRLPSSGIQGASFSQNTPAAPAAPAQQGPQNLINAPHGTAPTIMQASPQPKLNPKEAYENARSLLEKGDYAQANTKFVAFIHDYPQDEQVPSATYWLGVSYLAQGHYDQASSTFANLYKAYPNSGKAPDSLLKLAKSLRATGRKGDACTTLTEFKSKFPGKLQTQFNEEWASNGCS